MQLRKNLTAKKYEEKKEALITQPKLVQLGHEVPIDIRIQNLSAGKPHHEEARNLFLELEFYSILNDYLKGIPSRRAYNEIDSKTALNS